MNTGEALKVLVQAGFLTAKDAQDIETRANNERAARITAAREIAKRAMADYLAILIPEVGHSEHLKFVEIVFDELEKNLDPTPKKEPESDPDDEIKKFLKSLGVA